MRWKELLKRSRRSRRLSDKNAPRLSERDLINREDITRVVKGDHRNTARKVEDMTKENAPLRKCIQYHHRGTFKAKALLLPGSRYSTRVATYLCKCTLRILMMHKLRIHKSSQRINKRMCKRRLRRVAQRYHPTLHQQSHRRHKP